MELIIKINDKRVYNSLVQFLKSLNIQISSTHRKNKIKADGVSLLSEKALSEEWNSKEDEAWDKIL